jgi:hypothetical protein
MVTYEWYDKEESYLKQLHDMCLTQSKEYMALYHVTHATQTKLRLPAIIMSSFSGVASFGTTSFPRGYQKYVSIIVGLINISIAMIQTYESYLKIGDIVSKSLTVANSLKKLADDIYCEIFIPVEDRETAGITFLRDCFSRYQAIVENAPPMPAKIEEGAEKKEKRKNLISDISANLKQDERVEFGKTFRRTMPIRSQRDSSRLETLQEDHVYAPSTADDIQINVRQVIGEERSYRQ